MNASNITGESPTTLEADYDFPTETKVVLGILSVITIIVACFGNIVVIMVLYQNLKFSCCKKKSNKRRLFMPITLTNFQENHNRSLSRRLSSHGNNDTTNESKQDRRQTSNGLSESSSIKSLFLFNLCLADIIQPFLFIPTGYYNDVLGSKWYSYEFLLKMIVSLQGIPYLVSAFTHVLISFDRFIIIYYPLRPRMKYATASVLVTLLWVLALVCCLPATITARVKDGSYHENWGYDTPEKNSAIGNYYTISIMVLQYFIPLVIICVTYSAIFYKIHQLKNPGEISFSRENRMIRAKSRVIRTMITVAIIYGLSQSPKHIVYLLLPKLNDLEQSTQKSLWVAGAFISMSSCSYNPLIYCWMNHNFRHHFIRMFKMCLTFGHYRKMK